MSDTISARRQRKQATIFPGLFWVTLAGLFSLWGGRLPAQLINVDFNQNNGVSWGGGGPDPGPTMSGPAVLGKAGDQWNGINVNSGANLPLKYADGSASPVKMTFTSGGGYDANSFGGSTPFASTPCDALMEDYLYSGGNPQSITLTGLAANAAYNLILYNAANSGAAGRTTYFTVNGISRSSVWDGSSSTLIAGVNFVNFKTALSDSSGKLAIAYSGNGTAEGDLNGFQIQTAPFKISASCGNSNLLISFSTETGLNYQVQVRTNLTDVAWTALGSAIPGNDTIQTITNAIGGSRRFFRVQISTNAPAALTRLHTGGTNLVNDRGAVVQLRGLNLGGWFIMEKWMCPLDSGSLPDTYSAITNLDRRFGVATEQNLIYTYQTNWITTDDLNNIANAGYNCVRTPVWWGNFYSITNSTSSGWRPDAFTVLDWLVTNCAARGIYVIIDLHGVVGGQNLDPTTGWQNKNQYWTNSAAQNQTAYLWAQLAAHYRDNSAVAGYDLINEPYGAPDTAAVWAAYTNLYSTIRAVDPSHVIIMEGTFGSWNWSMLPDPSWYGWTNVVYQMHEYQWGGTVAQIEAGADAQVTDFQNHAAWKVPGYVGEWNNMGMGAACYDYSINAYDHAGLSWSMWAYKATHGLVPDGWGWYDPIYWPTTPNLQTDSAAAIANDWQQWRTITSFGLNAAVGL
ncbi:MAG TPA: cellulase family glycosylhydrolase [Candidatus Acidoferrum sp.]|nr:cellulase family glycosylhydrolase [Candidatus Acidoferrum sp.]